MSIMYIHYTSYYFLKVYPMNRNPRGFAVIFNNRIFLDTDYNRRGSEFDEQKLHMLFTDLGFEVLLYRNKYAQVKLPYCIVFKIYVYI